MPVGNSDRGVGLGAGEIMLFSDYSYQNFNWWHDVVPDAIATNGLPEDFEHKGTFINKVLNLGMTVGLNDYWNITASTMLNERCMDWKGPVDSNGESLTVHHRTECADVDFSHNGAIKAYGGQIGDSKINLKFLFLNQGKGTGDRVFLGAGLVVPSSNTLTESPWVLSDHDDEEDTPETYTPHRHFYLSDGAYKVSSEVQFFRKRKKIPVFWGGTLGFEFPVNESKYGFKPSKKYEVSMLALSGPVKFIKTNFFKVSSIGLNLSAIHMSGSYWDGEPTKNSKSTMYVGGLSILFATKAGTFGVNYQVGRDDYDMRPGDIKEETDIRSITISYRRLLDKIIDKLYW